MLQHGFSKSKYAMTKASSSKHHNPITKTDAPENESHIYATTSHNENMHFRHQEAQKATLPRKIARSRSRKRTTFQPNEQPLAVRHNTSNKGVTNAMTWTEKDLLIEKRSPRRVKNTVSSTYFSTDNFSQNNHQAKNEIILPDEIPCKDIETLFQSKHYSFNQTDSTELDSQKNEHMESPLLTRREHRILKYQPDFGFEQFEIVARKTLPQLPFSELVYHQSRRHLSNDYGKPKSIYSDCSECILLFGGISVGTKFDSLTDRDDGRQVFRYIPALNKWDLISYMPKARQYHSAVFFQKRVYIAGGMFTGSKSKSSQKDITSSMWSFDPHTRSWFTEQNMPESRRHFGFVAAHLQIYVIGGEDSNQQPLASVLCYDPVAATWKKLRSMKVPRSGLATVKYRNFIWVAGGRTPDHSATASVECYDLITNRWTEMADLRISRCMARMCAIHDHLYIIGGTDERSIPLTSIDCYAVKEKFWKILDEMDVAREGHDAVTLNSQFIIIGGTMTEAIGHDEKVSVKNIECFCTERCVWINGIEQIPKVASGLACVLLSREETVS